VFDIQDIGARFYTYASTLGYAMEVAQMQGLRFVVLDRPNPLNGMVTEGNVADEANLGFTAYHTIALRHGMTMGELSFLYKKERCPRVALEVVPCEGWRRAMWWDECGLTWVNPSPNIRSLNQAILYPGVGMLEFTNISVGRGTHNPFEQMGAPWIDGVRLADELNALGLPGVRCYPTEFVPDSSKYEGSTCRGVFFLVTDRETFRSVRFGCELAFALHKLHPQWEPSNLALLTHSSVFASSMLSGGASCAEERSRESLLRFESRRNGSFIYAV
jgi:uncharacterized protein YbbC (DUF1343 family)